MFNGRELCLICAKYEQTMKSSKAEESEKILEKSELSEQDFAASN